MKKVKIVLFISSVFVILAIAIYLYLNQIEVKEEYGTDIFNNIVAMDAGRNNKEASYYIIKDGEKLPSLFSRVYFGSIEHKYLQYTKCDKLIGRIGNGEYADKVVEYVSIGTSDVWRTVNITDIASKHSNFTEKIDYETLGQEGCNWYGEKSIVISYEYDSAMNKTRKKRYLIYNLEKQHVDKIYETDARYYDIDAHTGIVLSHKWGNTKEGLGQLPLHMQEYLQANGLSDKVIRSGVSFPDGEPNGYPLGLKISDLPKNNESLYNEFPYLAEVKSDSSMQDYYVVLIFPYSMSADEVVYMLTEEGSEVSYEGVYVNEKCSVDGEKHYVDSLEEFMQYHRVEEGKISVEKYEK